MCGLQLGENHKLVGSEIYDFSSDSWRVFDVVAPLNCRFIKSSKVMSLKGNTYWIATDTICISRFLLSFDFTRERFRTLCLPTIQHHGGTALSVVREEKLSLLESTDTVPYRGTLKIDMWVTNKIDTEAVSWSKYFEVNILPIHDGYLGFYVPTSFLIDEEKKVVVCCYAYTAIDPREKKVVPIIHKYYTETPCVEAIEVSSLPYIFNYAPSLVQIQQAESKE